METRIDAPAIDWSRDLVAVHVGGPVPGSPAAIMAGTIVAVTAVGTPGDMGIFGISGFRNGVHARSDGSTRTHWRIRNA